MLQFQAGDRQAFEQLVQQNVSTVHALVYRFLREPSQVEDITQEVFLRIFRSAPKYQPTAKFSTWLYRIVANLCFNVMRSRKKKRAVSLDSFGDEDNRQLLPDPKIPAPSQRLAKEELRDKVAAAIAELPKNQQAAIILNKYEGKNYEEIADVLDTTTMAVKSLLSRARQNLQGRLRQYMKHG